MDFPETKEYRCPHCNQNFSISQNAKTTTCPHCHFKIQLTEVEEVDTEVVPETPPLLFELGDCEIQELIGHGGMGEVYKAWHKGRQVHVAVKVLCFYLTIEPDFIERFEIEAQTLARLNHPNIVQFISKGKERKTLYMIMELVEGETLENLIQDQRLNPSEICRIFMEICRGLNYAHKSNIIHRDIKPSNILIGTDGKIKISDFGLARLVDASRVAEDQPRLTETGVQLGTQGYIAPEQKKDSRRVDFRADIYSLGVMLYEALMGKLPEGRFPLPSQVHEGMDSRFDLIIEKSLQPEPKERFSSAREIENILAEILSGAPPTEENFPLDSSLGVQQNSADKKDEFNPKAPLILVAEDDPESLAIFSEYLEDILPQAELISAPNGEEALKLAQKRQPDIILLDVMLPKMNGIDTCRLIRKKSQLSHLPILMITAAYDDEQLKKDAYLSGTDDFISKPLNFHEIKAKLEKAITLREMGRTTT